MKLTTATRNLASNIAAFQDQEKLNMKQLVSKTKVSRRTLVRIQEERGYNPHADVLLKISKALNVRISDLIGA